MNFKSKTFGLFALAGIMSIVLNGTSLRAQTTPEMPQMPNGTMSEPMTPEQIRQQQQEMMGQMQQMMGQMQQRMAQMSPEQLRQHHQQMMEHMEQMTGQMERMMEWDNSTTDDSFRMPRNPNRQHMERMNERMTE